MDEAKRLEVPLERLHAPCDAASLGFATTRELDILEDAVGQEDAIAAIEFGLPRSPRFPRRSGSISRPRHTDPDIRAHSTRSREGGRRRHGDDGGRGREA